MLIRARVGMACAAGCAAPVIVPAQRGRGALVVAVNVYRAAGKDLRAGEHRRAAVWDRLEIYHRDCYERAGSSRYGPVAPDRYGRGAPRRSAG